MKLGKSTLFVLLLVLGSSAQRIQDYTRWVNPFIGTGGHGHTFPGAVMPFGMVQLSPDTRGADWDGSSGYHYSEDIIYGFSHTHLSGTGIPDGCDILLMPIIGQTYSYPYKDSTPGRDRYAVQFSHLAESAHPGYYSVKLNSDIQVELTATKRVGFHRYTFPSSDNANIVIDLLWRDKMIESELKTLTDKRHVEGFRRSSSWAKNQVVYFSIEFSEPFTESKNDGGFQVFQFRIGAARQLKTKVAISFVSIEGARKNLEAELPGWDFDKVRADAKAEWNQELSKIEVSGGTPDQMTTFYTALYHTMIHPSLFSDVDGNYRGLDDKIHNIRDDARVSGLRVSSPHVSKGSMRASSTQSRFKTLNSGRVQPPATAGGSDQYTVFSLWDTFRAAHPLYTIIDQKRTVDFINTFIRMYEQGGRLPVWELWGNETDTMIGYHAVSVIADAMAKGIKGFDYEKAYQAAKHSAMLDRDGLAAYKRRGYISMEDENESVSKTLEYAYDDWCIAQMAKQLAKGGTSIRAKSYLADYETYGRRARYFENLFDPSTGFMRPKKNSGFISPFAPNEVTFNFTEGNSWVYSFFAPHDVSRLIELQGGKAKFAAKLDELFTTTDKLTGREQPDITGLIGQYAHGNEPSHHIAYLYDYVGQPSKTQRLVRKIMNEFYKPAPDGLIGNEDCGQMSAWYVLSASGFYPVVPGTTRYDLGTPLFKQITYHLENGNTFTIKAPNVSPSKIYIRSAKWNGRKLSVPYIVQEQIAAGGVLELDMGATPNDRTFESVSTSSVFRDFSATPIIEGTRSFADKTLAYLRSSTPGATIYYMIAVGENAEFKGPVSMRPYEWPITIADTCTLRAFAINEKGEQSGWAEARFYKKPNHWTVEYDSKYSYQYTGGGDEGLVDGIRGTVNFSSGEWQGYQGQDFIATVDLQKQRQILMLGAGFLQNVRSWIWMPTHIEFEYSQDGVDFSKIANIKTDVAQNDMEPRIRDFITPIKPVDARHIRIHAYNIGKIPAWHPGAGGDPWIFVDEIIIR